MPCSLNIVTVLRYDDQFEQPYDYFEKMSDPIVISTDDVCVRASDLKTVEAGFLSDMIISFVFCELERSLPTSFKSEITLLQATTVYMANSMSADELAMILSSLKLNGKSKKNKKMKKKTLTRVFVF